MDTIIFSSENAILKYAETDDLEGSVIPTIDYEVELNGNGDYIGGDFIFEMDEALNSYNFTTVDELITHCKHLINGVDDVRQMWMIIKDDFEAHKIDVSPDEYEGGYNL